MIDYMLSFEFSSFIALYVYWLPAAVCSAVYFFRGVSLYKRDLRRCSDKFYTPGITVGTIAWWFILSFTPAVNLMALVFDCASSVFKWFGSVLNIPLVPSRSAESA